MDYYIDDKKINFSWLISAEAHPELMFSFIPLAKACDLDLDISVRCGSIKGKFVSIFNVI